MCLHELALAVTSQKFDVVASRPPWLRKMAMTCAGARWPTLNNEHHSKKHAKPVALHWQDAGGANHSRELTRTTMDTSALLHCHRHKTRLGSMCAIHRLFVCVVFRCLRNDRARGARSSALGQHSLRTMLHTASAARRQTAEPLHHARVDDLTDAQFALVAAVKLYKRRLRGLT